MLTYVLSGIFRPQYKIGPQKAREKCTNIASLVRLLGYVNYEVWAGLDNEGLWRLLVALPGPFDEMPGLEVIDEVDVRFAVFAIPDTTVTGWVGPNADEGFMDLVVPGWRAWTSKGGLQSVIRISSGGGLKELRLGALHTPPVTDDEDTEPQSVL
ncbi:hypothetical protein BJX99DRAFT_265317 [Aspergillus californicus]